MADELKGLEAALFKAIAAEDISALREALNAGADVEAVDAQGCTPLHTAIVIGNAIMTRLLLEAGADPNRQCSSSHPPLVLVAKLESPLQSWLMRLEGNPVPSHSNAALSMISQLVAHGVDMTRWGPEAAGWAITNSSLEVLKALDEAGLAWSSHWPGQEGEDLLPLVDMFFSQALFSGVTTPEVVGFLLAHGADLNCRENGRPLLSCFLSRDANLDLKVLESLLAATTDIDAIDAQGATALMHAASRCGDGRVEALEHLLAAGADPLKKDIQGKTAADWAAAVPAPAYLDVFRRHGVDTHPADGPPVGAMPFPAQDLRVENFFVLEPIGKPLSLRWVGIEESREAALSLVERRFDWSRSPVGPFPVLQLVSAADVSRTANPYAVRHIGRAEPGSLLVLSLTAFSQKDVWAKEPSTPDPHPIFVVSGIFSTDEMEAAQSLAKAQSGWSLVVRVEALPMMEDGYQNQITELEVD